VQGLCGGVDDSVGERKIGHALSCVGLDLARILCDATVEVYDGGPRLDLIEVLREA